MRGWIPSGLHAEEDRLLCRWTYVGEAPFTEPFFEESLQRCRGLRENASRFAVLTDPAFLSPAAAALPCLEPAAFIFHVSRCGSTLVTQLLGEDPAFLTLSEVPFFDELLRARYRPEPLGSLPVAAVLPAALKLHGQRRQGAERHLVVKLDSWHIAFHAELRALFPRAAFILLYREPAAVLRSQRRHPGMQCVPGLLEPELFGLRAEEVRELHPEPYFAQVLAFYYRAFLEAARRDPRSLLLPYEARMGPAVEALARFAGIELETSHRARMEARSLRHAKRADEAFQEAEAQPIEVPAFCQAAFEALEAFRLSPTH